MVQSDNNPLTQPRRTRIIATIGPATGTEEKLAALIDAGVNIFRLNMSHASHEDVTRHTQLIRELSKQRGRTTAVLMDTQGPAIRTGELESELNLKPGQVISLTVRGEVSEEFTSVDVNYDDLVNDISVGDVVIVDNGNMKLKVLEKKRNRLDCEVLTEGTLGSRRHINLPGVRVNLPALTDKDIKDVELGIEIGVDWFAMSFVREAKDVERLRAILEYRKAPQKICAKLEDQQGVRNVGAIIDAADAIMVARGDLGIEVPYEELPPLQRRVVKTCISKACPVIVATHMLESMIENPLPTRAEVTDVANAVFEQADAIMLSGETSVGRYPIEAVGVMDRIARRIEKSGGAEYGDQFKPKTIGGKLCRTAADLAERTDAAAMVVFTRSGGMARYASVIRPLGTPLFAFTPDAKLANQLVLLWGCEPFCIEFGDDTNQIVRRASELLLETGRLKKGDPVIFITEATIRDKVIDTIQLENIG